MLDRQALLYSRRGDLDAAASLIRVVGHLYPDHWLPRLHRLEIAYSRKALDEANQALDAATEAGLGPALVAVWRSILAESPDPVDAARLIARADERQVVTLPSAVRILNYAGHRRRAETMVRTRLERQPTSALARELLLTILLADNRFEEAADLPRVVPMSTVDQWIEHLHLLALGNRTDALMDWVRANAALIDAQDSLCETVSLLSPVEALPDTLARLTRLAGEQDRPARSRMRAKALLAAERDFGALGLPRPPWTRDPSLPWQVDPVLAAPLVASPLVEQAVGGGRWVISFSGLNRAFGLSALLLTRLLNGMGYNVLIARDMSRAFYLGGFPGLGADPVSASAALSQMLADRGATAVYTLGNSAGGHAALRYGLTLNARAALAFGAPSSIAVDPLEGDDRAEKRRQQLEELFGPAGRDLVEVIAHAVEPTRLLAVYGEEHALDRLHGERLAATGRVETIPMAGRDDHGGLTYLLSTGQLRPLFERAFGV
jgi:hypothetical protein